MVVTFYKVYVIKYNIINIIYEGDIDFGLDFLKFQLYL